MSIAQLFELLRTDRNFFLFGLCSIFVLGCCIGSFLNVCIWRVPRKMSIVHPPSHCPKCGHQITALENIPLLSWIFLGGKCSSCHQPITIRYFLVELLVGILFALLFLSVIVHALPSSLLLSYCILCSILVCSAFTDCELGVIPDEFTFFGMACALILGALCPANWNVSVRWASLLLSFLSMAVTCGMLAFCAWFGKKIFKREALGWGDVKLITASGGLFGLYGAMFMILSGSLFALIGFPLLRLFVRKYRHRKTLKFGPFLAAGGIIWMLYGPKLLPHFNRLSEMLR